MIDEKKAFIIILAISLGFIIGLLMGLYLLECPSQSNNNLDCFDMGQLNFDMPRTAFYDGYGCIVYENGTSYYLEVKK